MSENDKGFPAWNGCKNILIFNPKVIRVYLAGNYQYIMRNICFKHSGPHDAFRDSREDFPGRTFLVGLSRKDFPGVLFILF